MVAVCFLNTESLNLHFTRNLNIAAYILYFGTFTCISTKSVPKCFVLK